MHFKRVQLDAAWRIVKSFYVAAAGDFIPEEKIVVGVSQLVQSSVQWFLSLGSLGQTWACVRCIASSMGRDHCCLWRTERITTRPEVAPAAATEAEFWGRGTGERPTGLQISMTSIRRSGSAPSRKGGVASLSTSQASSSTTSMAIVFTISPRTHIPVRSEWITRPFTPFFSTHTSTTCCNFGLSPFLPTFP